MRLYEVVRGIADVRTVGDGSVDVAGIRYDSRRVREGDLFAAIRGESFDGARFIPEARARGARSFLTEPGVPPVEGCATVQAANVRRTMALAAKNLFGDPSSRIPVVGITGTNGKTTTSYLVHGVLESAGRRAGLIGTVQYLVGGQVLSASRTTPESTDLNAHLVTMIESGCRACIMEVSSHALTLDRVAGLRMAAAVFTNLTREHLDFHRDMEDYFRAKARLFTEGDVAACVVNRDDPYGRRLQEQVRGEVVTYGLSGGDIRPTGGLVTGDWGSRCSLATPWGEVRVDSPLPGRFNVSNIMAAVGACGVLGLSAESISEGIAAVRRVPGRFERVDRGQPFTAIVDYAHTPDALENLLTNVRAMTKGRVVAVFGCGGDRDRTKRPVMGEVAARLADLVFVTSDNPRREAPEAIIDQILEGVSAGRPHVRRVQDRREAIAAAVGEAAPGDAVVLAGKGHENYQIVGDRIIPFSDVDELAAAIKRAQGGDL